jgi:hypothetical protein
MPAGSRAGTPGEPLEIVSEAPKPSKYDISRVMAEMGRKGGQIGGKRRLKTMTKEQRRKIATKSGKSPVEKVNQRK